MLPGGKLLSLIPQRCICRQSNIGAATSTNDGLMSPAFSPSRMRRATSAAFLVCSGNDLHRTADDALSEKRLIVRKDRCVGYAIEPSKKRAVAFMRHARRIDIQPDPKDRAVWRKVRRRP